MPRPPTEEPTKSTVLLSILEEEESDETCVNCSSYKLPPKLTNMHSLHLDFIVACKSFLVLFLGLPQSNFSFDYLQYHVAMAAVFAYCKQSKAGARQGPGMKLALFIRKDAILCISYLECINAADEPHFTPSH